MTTPAMAVVVRALKGGEGTLSVACSAKPVPHQCGRADHDITRCTCGAWAWRYEPCPECGLPEVLADYRWPTTSGSDRASES